MQVGLVGLGKMGLNLLKNMQRNNLEVTAFDLNKGLKKEVGSIGASFAESLEELISNLSHPRIIWLMLPSGEVTKTTALALIELLDEKDILIDGGNSFYKDSIALYEQAKSKGIYFFDCGSSGGQSGALNGGNFMIAGDEEIFPQIEPIYKLISEEKGYLFTGSAGSGHYLKMVHNGIEYGMMQAIGEGFDLLEHSPYNYHYEDVANLWNNGSVIRSWLMELTAKAFSKDPELEELKGRMESSGEGKWTVQAALEAEIALPVITSSLMMRYRSLEEDTFSGKVVASLRNEFGGHDITKKEN
ncbi:MAG: phosphogluconate dehydrogenase (NAD(+)-dependent, decarboxylating) [Lactovum sp.]